MGFSRRRKELILAGGITVTVTVDGKKERT